MKFILIYLLIISFNVYSGGEEPHPIIDSNYVSKYEYNFQKMDLVELENTRLLFLKNINNSENRNTKESLDEKLLKELLEYDDERIKITKVIDEIIKEYNVNNEIKQTLLSFQETFTITIGENRHLVKDLRGYKAYDFRLGANYLAMMSALHENEESRKFYSRLVKDKKNPNTSIGKYNEKLKLAQSDIVLVKKEIKDFLEVNDIKNLLEKINIEISNRK